MEDLPHYRVAHYRVLTKDSPPVVLFTLPGLELPAIFASETDARVLALPRKVVGQADAPHVDAETHDHLPGVHARHQGGDPTVDARNDVPHFVDLAVASGQNRSKKAKRCLSECDIAQCFCDFPLSWGEWLVVFCQK